MNLISAKISVAKRPCSEVYFAEISGCEIFCDETPRGETSRDEIYRGENVTGKISGGEISRVVLHIEHKNYFLVYLAKTNMLAKRAC